jgi:predicted nucleic acid-binding protein
LAWDQLSALGRTVAFGGKQVHDANLVATMLAHGETRLLTVNAADFQRFAAVIEVVAP